MSLLKCPDCEKMISDLAPACIGCGRPMAASIQQSDINPEEKSIRVDIESKTEQKDCTANCIFYPPQFPIPENNSTATAKEVKDVKDITEDRLFEAKRAWDAGNHADDNIWAIWKFEQAKMVRDPNCGTFEYWESISSPNTKKRSLIERKAKWAELVIWGANLSTSFTGVSGYVRSDGTYVSSHLRKS